MPEKLGYKRLETDEEFFARVAKEYPWVRYGSLADLDGAVLDDLVWWNFKMQRRIVEVFP